MQGIKGMQELRMKPGRLSHHGETEETRSLSEASVLSCVSYENTFSAVISSPYLHLLAGLDRRKRIFIRYGEPQAHGNSVVNKVLEFFISSALHNTSDSHGRTVWILGFDHWA